ncbi:ABC transporter substrate-binding protein [Pseudomonas jinjuensis]|uniref:Branched-chain amino acid transport system substrate-binding protein n=1 Tax=Pseudomonas jinjuensis TaxID=198616 RepID=A0A1H0DC54_9PSED|nr:ABC transporter substrate-binding protein [Pseudomonas jinjuensis]SDN67724.1 branched-chain amino acid transport system substrate-binding protein [Pseudomonas jinjuensis]
MNDKKLPGGLSRRDFLRATGAVAGAAVLANLPGAPAFAGEKVIRIGYVSPQTGPLAPFAAADRFIIDGIGQLLKNRIDIAGKSYRLEIIVKDSQSNPNRAAQVASELILSDGVDLMLVSSTPETTNPVSDQCEINEVPCISTVAPWQPWFFTRGGDPAQGFEWTYHFFWGLEDVIGAYTAMWEELPGNKVIGGLFPNDGDGNAWGDGKLGFPPVLAQKGFQLVDPGRFQSLTDDFSAQISAFRKAEAEIVTGVVIPPDLATFWTQARQQGFRPKVVSVGKALLFPSAVQTLGSAGHNLSTEIWWSPNHPFASSLNGQSSAQLAAGYTQATGKQWTQPLGFVHALFELAVDILRRTPEIGNPAAVRDSLLATRLDTVVGPVSWKNGPVKNVAKTPLVAGQWRQSGKFGYDLVITANRTAPNIPLGGEMQPIVYGS